MPLPSNPKHGRVHSFQNGRRARFNADKNRWESQHTAKSVAESDIATADHEVPTGLAKGGMAYVTGNDKLYFKDNVGFSVISRSELTPPNLVTNGDFSTSDLTGWTEQYGTISIVNNALHVTRELGSGWSSYYTLTGLSVGTDYTLSFDLSPQGGGDGMRITETLNTQVGGIALSGASYPGPSTLSGTFTATQTTMYMITIVDTSGDTIVFDNISVTPA